MLHCVRQCQTYLGLNDDDCVIQNTCKTLLLSSIHRPGCASNATSTGRDGVERKPKGWWKTSPTSAPVRARKNAIKFIRHLCGARHRQSSMVRCVPTELMGSQKFAWNTEAGIFVYCLTGSRKRSFTQAHIHITFTQCVE